MSIKKELQKITYKYVDIFCEKHDLYLDYIVNDDPLGVYCFSNEYYVSINDIVYSVENNINEDVFFDWYQETFDRSIDGKKTINFVSYSNGFKYSDLK